MTNALELAAYDNLIQPFLIHDSDIRGRVVRIGGVVDAILNQHDYPPSVSKLLAELCLLAAMLSTNLKGRGKLTMQLRGEGDVAFMVADITAKGAMRGYAELKEGASFKNDNATLTQLMGKGYLAITLQKGDKPYQGIVELSGDNLSESMQHYFTHSEQSLVYVKTACAQREINGEKMWISAGLMLQHMPNEGGKKREQEEPDFKNYNTKDNLEENGLEVWNRNRILGATVKEDELLDIYLSPQALLFRLYNEDGVWVYDAEDLRAECNCSRARVKETLEQFPDAELEAMMDDGKLNVNCQFCNTNEEFTLAQLKQ